MLVDVFRPKTDVGAVFGRNTSTSTNFGYGVHGIGGYMGVRGEATSATSGNRFGVYGIASGGTTGTRFGVYGFATKGSAATSRAYAVYASGDLKVTERLFIGTTETDEDNASSYELLVDGEAIMEEAVIKLTGDWPDYVFENDYDLKPLIEVQSFIDENGHLPNVPSAKVLEAADGVAIGEMQRIMMEKIEELTLYTIDQENRIKALVKEVEELKKK